jgi:hypothetical protein
MEQHNAAHRYFMEAVEVCREFDLRAMRSHVLALLAFNDFGLGDPGSMSVRLREGLPVAYALKYEPALSLSILAVGAHRILTGDPQGAAGLVGMVDAYPGTHADVRALGVARLRQALENVLESHVLAAALERGADLDFDATVTALIADLTK